MKRNNVLLMVIVFLFAVNCVTLSFIWRHRPLMPFRPQPFHQTHVAPHPEDFMVRELGFDADQQKAFTALRSGHMERMRASREKLDIQREQLFRLLGKDDIAQVRKRIEQIGVLQKDMETATFEHFAAVRALCTDRQKTKFDAVIMRVTRMMTPPRPPARSRRSTSR